MTDRLKGFIVTLDHDMRDDDAEVIVNAISMIKGVLTVKPSVRDLDDLMNRELIRQEITNKLYEVLK